MRYFLMQYPLEKQKIEEKVKGVTSTKDIIAYLEFSDNSLLPSLFGEHDRYLEIIEHALHVKISVRGNQAAISGSSSEVIAAQTVLNKLYQRLREGININAAEVEAAIHLNFSPKKGSKKFSQNRPQSLINGTFNQKKVPSRKTTFEGRGHYDAPMNHHKLNEDMIIPTRKQNVMARTMGQVRYMQSLQNIPLVFAIGPAGTGKTYLAVATGVSMLLQGKVDRLILSRPAVEAGEHLGFLPGDLKDKVDPYLRPLYDALYTMLPAEQVIKMLESGKIEIAPLAFMRGRTLSNAFIILDEAQNATVMQMKMFLTRLGEGSSMVITGDLTQMDLLPSQSSGLQDAIRVLEGVNSIEFVYLDESDAVRHPLVNKIIIAYAKTDKNKF